MCISALRYSKINFGDEYLKGKGLNISGNEVLVRVFEQNVFLPVSFANRIKLVKWGGKIRGKTSLLRFCRNESLEMGKWQGFSPVLVEVPVCLVLTMGVWYQVRKGISGVYIENFFGESCVFIVTKPSTHYFEVMTRSKRMPVLLNQIL